MATTEDWIIKKIEEYNNDPINTILDMLATTTNAMELYNNNPTSKVAKGVFDAHIEHNNLFLKELNAI